MTIYEKLQKIQLELKAPKSNYNSFGKYNYRSCEDILEAVKPVAAKHGAVVRVTDEIKNLGDRYYVMATAFLTDTETSEYVFCLAYAREEEDKKGMDGAQITGSASSYARKYALSGLFALDDTKDSDATNRHDQEPKPEHKPISLTQEQIKQIDALSHKVHGTGSANCITAMKKQFGVEKASQIASSKYQECLDFINNWQDALSIDLESDDTSLPFDIA